MLDTLPEERGISTVAVAKKSGVNKKLLVLGSLFVSALGLSGYAYVSGFLQETPEESQKAYESRTIAKKSFPELPAPIEGDELPRSEFASSGVESLPEPEAPPIELLPPVEEERVPRPQGTGERRPKPPRLDKSRSSLMVTTQTSAPQEDRPPSRQEQVAQRLAALTQPPQGSQASETTDDISSRLVSNGTERLFATRFQDRNFLLAAGSFIDCVLETRLDSTLPGMTSCVITRNIFSDNGKVLLLERGSQVIGEYQANVEQGQARLFILWTRIKTPVGVVIPLNSPGTDSLGGAGVPGKVNNKFFQRFGAAILLSVIDDAAAAIGNSLLAGDGQVFQFGNTASATQGAAAQVLENSLQIQPTLTKKQGELVGIFVAKDLDFSGVYDVE